MNLTEERELRNTIKHLIQHVKQKRLNEEQELRAIVRSMIDYEIDALEEKQTADVDPAPNKSTGINVLEDLLKKIVPVLEDDYKLLTTDDEQRQSFRSHIVKAVVDTLTPVETNNEAEPATTSDDIALEEVIDIEVGEEATADEDKFIDIRTDAEKKSEDEPEDPRDSFGSGLEDADQTGRNMAYATFKKVETAIIDSYELLSNEEDQELFYDYLIANTKLYFDKFESELSGQVEEPTNQAYDTAKADVGDPAAADLSQPTPDEAELGL